MSVNEYPFAPPEHPAFPPFIQWSSDAPLLSPPECRELIALGNARGLGKGMIGNGANNAFRLEPEYRTVLTRALYAGADDVHWLYQRIRRLVSAANRDFFRFDLTGIEEGIQFLRYDAPEALGGQAGHYKWHQDFGGGKSSLRKLSLVVQLSAPEDYEGCRLTFFTDRQYEPARGDGQSVIGQGEAVLFPSWTPHMVTPITRGTRYALAAWICGPQFR